MIDYSILDASIRYYTEKGFERIEAPWTVTQAVADITKPEEATNWTIKEKDKVLVASGEQSFLYLYLKGFLPKGAFQTITPCFRNDPFDFTHTKYFIKNELIDTKDVTEDRLWDIINLAKRFFAGYLFTGQLSVVETSEFSYDINLGKYELGSYGIRHCEFLSWIYGTGVAEPRFSNIRK